MGSAVLQFIEVLLELEISIRNLQRRFDFRNALAIKFAVKWSKRYPLAAWF